MCGLAGILGQSDETVMKRMLTACQHRGPDASGVWIAPDQSITFGQARLAIIDLSPAGRQPLSNDDGTAWITYNGEVYNHAEIRHELESLGHRFRTATDTEVILHAYLQWGEASLTRLRGMFAFAIAHQKQSGGPWEVFLARDRLGIKPLYLAQGSNGTWYFASELTTLLATGNIARRLNWQAAFDVLATGSVIQPGTILEGVTALPAGHCCTWKQGTLSTPKRWWSLEESAAHQQAELASLSFEEQSSRLLSLLQEVTRYHLIADVPVGIFLSGGVDSTAAAALMSKLVTYPVHSFSVGLDSDHQDMDELSAARVAAQSIGTQHHEHVIREADVPEVFENFVRKVDQPSEDGANTMVVSQLAKEHGLKVVLSGVGMDELLGGYPNHFLVQKLAWFPGLAWKPAQWGIRTLHELRPNRYSMAMLAAITPRGERNRLLREHLSLGEVRQALPRAGSSAPSRQSLWPTSSDALNDYLRQEVQGYLTNTLLRDADVMTMASSLELRPLFLDHQLVEFCAALPSTSKCREGKGKAIFRHAMQGILPESTLTRRKQGFGLPKDRWMNGPLQKLYEALLQSSTAKQLLTPAWREKELARLQQRQLKWTSWTVATLLAYVQHHQLEVVR